MNNSIGHWAKPLVIMALLAWYGDSMATIKGKIVDSVYNTGLSGVVVKIKGTEIQDTTDGEGINGTASIEWHDANFVTFTPARMNIVYQRCMMHRHACYIVRQL